MMMFPDPLETLLSLQRALDAFRDSDWLEAGPSGTGPFPPLNVFRKGDDIVAIVEIPGVKKSDFEVQVKDNMLRIGGTKTVAYADKASLHRRERLEGRFDRTVSLPVAIDGERVKAEYRDGILALYLPRAEHDKPRSIRIS
jgi:HSP20 family protein